jgi:hypothetical protein
LELPRLDGAEQHVQRDVVADEAHREAEGGHDPRILEERPRHHLDHPDAKPEVDSTAPHERHRVGGHAAHQLDQLLLVAHQRGDGQELQVDVPVTIRRDLGEHVLGDPRYLGVNPGLDRLPARFWKGIPQAGAELLGEIPGYLVDRLDQGAT